MRISNPLLEQLIVPPRAVEALPSRRDGPKAKAAQSRISALHALNDWGHLRTSELGRLLWPTAAYADQMAQRLARRLTEAGEVAGRRNAIGGISYVLTRRGAAALEAMGEEAHHGLELSSVAGATFIHRCLGARYGIEKHLSGFKAYGEHAVTQDKAPATRAYLASRFSKLPDLLLVRKGIVTWVEVESAAKPLRELMACVRIAEHAGQLLTPGGSLLIGGVVFVFDKSQGHARRILRAAEGAWGHLPAWERIRLFQRVQLAGVELGAPLTWHGFQENSLTEQERYK